MHIKSCFCVHFPVPIGWYFKKIITENLRIQKSQLDRKRIRKKQVKKKEGKTTVELCDSWPLARLPVLSVLHEHGRFSDVM